MKTKQADDSVAQMQKVLLKRYLELAGQPSLREISNQTGIQLTRVFRIFNGQELKLNEYLIFKQKVDELSGVGQDFWDLASELQKSLSTSKIKSVVRRLKRELKYGEICSASIA